MVRIDIWPKNTRAVHRGHGPYAAKKWIYLQQVEQMLIRIQLLPFVFAQRLETFVFVQSHHVRQLFFVFLGEFLMV